jgi:hypothetical protein
VLNVTILARQGADETAFAKAVALYVDLHRAAAAGLSVSATDAASAAAVETTLAQRIRAQRRAARPGDIFGPAAVRIVDVVNAAIAGPQGDATLSAIEESNVRGAKPRVNHRYPPGIPRVTMPGQLLAKLPPLPPELEYRFLGQSLLLIDRRAALIVDLLPDALPVRRR